MSARLLTVLFTIQSRGTIVALACRVSGPKPTTKPHASRTGSACLPVNFMIARSIRLLIAAVAVVLTACSGDLPTALVSNSAEPRLSNLSGNPTIFDWNKVGDPLPPGVVVGGTKKSPNPVCVGLNVKIEPPASGTLFDGALQYTLQNNVISFTANGVEITHVLVKAGTATRIYYYSTPVTSGEGITSAPNPRNGRPVAISHFVFCYVPGEPVEKGALGLAATVVGAYDRAITWELDKTVDVDTVRGFVGGSATPATWSVTATKSATENNYRLSGTLEVRNPTSVAVTATVAAALSGAGTDRAATVVCPVSGNATESLAPGSEASPTVVTCEWSGTATGIEDVALSASATVTAGVGVSDGSATAALPIAQWTPSITGTPSITINDEGATSAPWTADTTATFTATESASCSNELTYTDGVNARTVTNTATIAGTETSATAEYTAVCYAPLSEQSATAAWGTDYAWTIEKSVLPATHSLQLGASATSTYTVVATRIDSNGNGIVTGTLTVTNPHPSAAMTVSVVSAGAELSCDGTLTVNANSSATCTITKNVGAVNTGITGTLNATVSLNSVSSAADASYTFGAPTTTGSASVDVQDRFDGGNYASIGTADGTKTFTYEKSFSCSDNVAEYVNGEYSYTKNNTARIGTDGDSASANVGVTCLPPLSVTATADGAFDRDISWALAKTVDVDTARGFLGGNTAPATWSITATKQETDDNYELSGTVVVSNRQPATVGATVGVNLTIGSSTIPATVSCPVSGTAALSLAAGSASTPSTATCTWTATATAVTDVSVAATVTITGESDIADGSASASLTAAQWIPSITGTSSITINDEGATGAPWTTDTTATFTSPETLSCGSGLTYTDGVNSRTISNTATIDGTATSATAEFTAVCYAPLPAQTAAGSWGTEYTWDIDKTVSPATHSLEQGASATSTYTVVATRTATDGTGTVTGTLTVANPSPFDAMTVSVASEGAELSCDGTLTVSANSSATCTITKNVGTVTNGTTGTLTTTVSINEVDATATASYTFGAATTTGSASVDVQDSFDGGSYVSVGTANGTQTITYTKSFSCSNDASVYANGIYSYTKNNTARIGTDGDTDDASVAVDCKLAPGAVLLVMDEDALGNSRRVNKSGGNITASGPQTWSATEVNDGGANEGVRTLLPYFRDNVGRSITILTGQVGDEGWFAPNCIPRKWVALTNKDDNTCLTDATRTTGMRNFFFSGKTPYSGAPTTSNIPNDFYDKIPDVIPLRANGLVSLVGKTVCAVVYKSDVSINYGPINGNLQGATNGIVAFKVTAARDLTVLSSSTMPEMQITIVDPATACTSFQLFNAPVPRSSSVPNDIRASNPITTTDSNGYLRLLFNAALALFY